MFDMTAVTAVGVVCGDMVEFLAAVDAALAQEPWEAIAIPGEPEAFFEGETLIIARCASWRGR